MKDLWLVCLLLILNLIAALVYLVFHLRRGNRKKGLVVFAFMLAAPVVGPLFLGCAELLLTIVHQRRKRDVDLTELSFNKKRVRVLSSADIEKEANRVPIEEALLVSGKSNKRGAFIDLLKEDDYEGSMQVIRNAVEDDDMEISHYAAAFVTDTVARYKDQEASYRRLAQENPTPENLTRYLDFMQDILQQKLFSTSEQRLYAEFLDDFAHMLYEKDPSALQEKTMACMVELWRQLGNEQKAEEWIGIARPRCMDSLDAFKLCAKYYYSRQKKDAFFRLIDEVKKSSLILDSEALDWIRFYM